LTDVDGNGTDADDLGNSSSVLPTEGMADDDFEDFLERVLTGLRQAEDPSERVVSVNRYGRRGDPQYGRDFLGTLSDGRSAMWQAKAYKKFEVTDVRKAIKATPKPSDINRIVLSCVASTAVRDEIAQHPGWEVVDARDLHDQLQLVPLHRRREILDDTWGPVIRRKLMASPGQDSIVTLGHFAEARRHPETLVNDCRPFVGREETLTALLAALSNSDTTTVILANGPAGRGKSRLVIEALQLAQAESPARPIVCLAPGHDITPAVIQDLTAQPCTVFVDDAHRQVDGLTALLTYANAKPGTQIVLTTRPSGAAAVRRALVDLDASRVHDLELGQLTNREAKALVAALTEGMDLEYGWTLWLRQMALDSPYLPVITIGLLRSAGLDGSLKTSQGLRANVLARYSDVTDEPIDGVAPDVVRRLVGVLSLLRRVEAEDQHTLVKVGELVGLPRAALLRLLESLVDRGVLTDPNAGAWVVTPELLGDASADAEAVAGRFDSGFATEVWHAFKVNRFKTLFPALAELGWRVREQRALDVVEEIWSDAHETLVSADPDAVLSALERADALPIFDPKRSLRLLAELQARFLPSRAQRPVGSRDWSAPARPEDVLQALAPLLGQVVEANQALLPEVLDLLWALRRSDARETHQHPTHPARVIAEGPGDPSASVTAALGLVDAVERWLSEPPNAMDVTTPLFALGSVIAKEASRTRQTSGKEIQLQSWLVTADSVRRLRDRVRHVLGQQGPGSDLRRASAAVKLLGDMLHSPRGMYGAHIPRETVLSWADDDLDTLRALADIGAATASATIRRLLRHEIDYAAESAADPRVRHAARALAIDLDNREDDDLAELLLHEWSTDLSRRGELTPSLADMQREVESELQADEEAAEARRNDRITRRIEQRDSQQATLTQRIVDDLIDLPPVEVLAVLRTAAQEVAVINPARMTSLWGIYQRIRRTHPDKAEPLLRALDSGAACPLDDQAAILIEAWADTDQQSLLEWVTPLQGRRPAIRHALGVFLTSRGKEQLGPEWHEVAAAGLTDEDPTVRDSFLLTLHHQLARTPEQAVNVLLAANASSWVCERALDAASERDGTKWGLSLSAKDGSAVLRLIDRIGWNDWTAQHVAAGIATNHPVLVLQHLTGRAQLWRLGYGNHLVQAFTQQAPAVIEWLLDKVASLSWDQRRDVATVVLGKRLAPEMVNAFLARTPAFSADELSRALQVLGGVGAWPQRAPDLARALLGRARELGCEPTLLEGLAASTGLWSYSGMNGESEDLNRAIEDATAAAKQETDVALRGLLERAAADLKAGAEHDRARYREDEDNL
jgi:hypothetical protein